MLPTRSSSAPRALRFALILLLAAATPLLAADDGLRGDALVERVDQLARAALEEPGAVGLSVAVALGDEMLVEKGYGKAELEHDVDVSAESVFRIGSVTKQFTAAAILKLIEKGAAKDGKPLSLDASISDFVDFPTQGREVTVRHLLSHTSGIKSYTGLGEEWLRTVPLELDHDELLAMVRDLDFDFEPGTDYRYNNSGYYLLGVILENVTGRSYGRWLEEEILDPLGLASIRYGSNRDIIPGRAQGYARLDGEVVNDGLIGMSQPGAAGALLSTAGDLVRWQRALMAGEIVGEESLRAMTTPHRLDDGESTGYGFGLAIGDLDGVPRISHGGGINGFNSMLAWYPEQELSVAVLSNSEGYRSGKLAEQIARAALGLELETSDLEIPADERQRVAGTYTLTGTPLELVVIAREGRLYAQASGQPESRLRLQGEAEEGGTEYRPDFDDAVRIVFADGSPAPALTLYQGGAVIEGPRKE